MLLFACASGPTKKELRETPIPEFLENHNGVLIPVPTAEGTGFPNYIKIFSLSDEDIRKMQPGGASKFSQSGTGKAIYYGLGLITNPIGTATVLTTGAGAAVGAIVKSKTAGASGSPSDNTEFQVRYPTKEELKINIAAQTALRKAGYQNDAAQLYSELYLVNNFKPDAKTTMAQLKEQLYSFYIHRKLGGLSNYQKFREINWKHQENIEAAVKGQPIKNQTGRPLNSEELDKVYHVCFTRIDQGEKVQFRKALMEYRLKNDIPSKHVSVDDYERCLMAYTDKQTHEENDFIEFEYNFIKNMAVSQ